MTQFEERTLTALTELKSDLRNVADVQNKHVNEQKELERRVNKVETRVTGAAIAVSALATIAGLVLAALALASCSPAYVRESRVDVPPGVAVALTTEDGFPVCSGTVTPQGILTAAHCTGAGDLYVATESSLVVGGLFGPHYTILTHASTIRVDEVLDLALLRSRTTRGARLAQSEPEEGDPVVMTGQPQGFPFVTARGHVARTAPMPLDGRHLLLLDINGDHGDSGAGVFDASGGLVGVCDIGLPGVLVGAVALQDIRTFLGRTQ